MRCFDTLAPFGRLRTSFERFDGGCEGCPPTGRARDFWEMRDS